MVFNKECGRGDSSTPELELKGRLSIYAIGKDCVGLSGVAAYLGRNEVKAFVEGKEGQTATARCARRAESGEVSLGKTKDERGM